MEDNHLAKALSNPPQDSYPEVRHLINRLVSAEEDPSPFQELKQKAESIYSPDKVQLMWFHVHQLQKENVARLWDKVRIMVKNAKRNE